MLPDTRSPAWEKAQKTVEGIKNITVRPGQKSYTVTHHYHEGVKNPKHGSKFIITSHGQLSRHIKEYLPLSIQEEGI